MTRLTPSHRKQIINAYRHDVACHLAKLAHDRKTVTYGELSDLFGGTPRTWGEPLSGIALRCFDHRLPLLSVLVVSQETGLPSPNAVVYEDLGLRSTDDIAAEQHRCFEYDWPSTPLWPRQPDQ